MKLGLFISEDIDRVWSIHIAAPDATVIHTEINIPEDQIQEEVDKMAVALVELIPIARKLIAKGFPSSPPGDCERL